MGTMCHRVIWGLSVALEIIANPEEELVSYIYTILATALLILFIPHMQHILCTALFKVEQFSFDTELWM